MANGVLAFRRARYRRPNLVHTRPQRDPSIFKPVCSFFKEFVKLGVFFFFNSLLPGSDVGTDLYTCIDLYRTGHILWASATFFFMWNPFIVQFLFMMARLWHKSSEFEAKEELRKLMFFFPLVTPFKNLVHTLQLYKLGFGMKRFKPRDSKRVEKIQEKVGHANMFESFLESGPQSVVQLKIVLSTGTISTAQMISIPVSVFSLAWASSRAYFIQRDEDNSDPDPEIKMVAMRIFPCMLFIVAHSIIAWTSITGLLGEYIIPCCLFYLLVAYVVQKWASKGLMLTLCAVYFCSAASMAVFAFALVERSKVNFALYLLSLLLSFTCGFLLFSRSTKVTIDKQENLDNNYFLTKSVITSIWLPCVVGDKPHTFIMSAIISFTYKNLLFILAVFLTYYDIIDVNVFLFWCKELSIANDYKARNLTLCYGLQSCFAETKNDTRQKIRICRGDLEKNSYTLILCNMLWLFSILSVLAAVKLHKKSNHVNLYKSTGTFLWFFKTKPVVHRSLVFDLAKANNDDLLKEVAKDKEMINRARRGETPLHCATSEGALMAAELLLRSGAELKEYQKNPDEPPIVPNVIELAVTERNTPLLDTITKIKLEDPDANHLTDEVILYTIKKKSVRHRTLLETSFFGDLYVLRELLKLALPAGERTHFKSMPELKFLQEQLALTNSTHGSNNYDYKLTRKAIAEMLTRKNDQGHTVLEDCMYTSAFEMMFWLALSTVEKEPEVVTEVVKTIIKPENLQQLNIWAKGFSSKDTASILAHKNSEGKSLLQWEEVDKEVYKALLSLAVAAVNKEPKVRSEAARELVKPENLGLLQQLDREGKFQARAIADILTEKNSRGETILHCNEDSELYDLKLTLTLSKGWAIQQWKEEPKILSEVAKEFRKPRNRDKIKAALSNWTQSVDILQKLDAEDILSDTTISDILRHKNKDGKTVLQNVRTEEDYKIMYALKSSMV